MKGWLPALIGCLLLAAPATAALPAAERAESAWAVLLREAQHEPFLAAADEAGLRPVLDGENPITVFTPDANALKQAMGALPEAEDERQAALRRLIGGHLMWGELHEHEVDGLMLRPVLAQFAVRIEPTSCCDLGDHDHHHHLGDAAGIKVAGEPVAEAERATSNGVLYQLSGVIEPPARGEASPLLQHAPACHNRPGSGTHGPASNGLGEHGGGHNGGHTTNRDRGNRQNNNDPASGNSGTGHARPMTVAGSGASGGTRPAGGSLGGGNGGGNAPTPPPPPPPPGSGCCGV
jgi:uncharacterized surface protein with fasciclin (FAS1) repeats